jgi:hypothetical protein
MKTGAKRGGNFCCLKNTPFLEPFIGKLMHAAWHGFTKIPLFYTHYWFTEKKFGFQIFKLT